MIVDYSANAATMAAARRLSHIVEEQSRTMGVTSSAQIAGNVVLVALEGYSQMHRDIDKADLALAVAALAGRALVVAKGELRALIIEELDAMVENAKGLA